MKKKKVYLFACIEKNIGDDLFIYLVSQRYPNVNFVISDDAKYLQQNNLTNLEYSEILRKWLKFANNESNNVIKRFLISILEKIYRLKLKKLDSIYIVGNAFKNTNYKGNYQINWLKKRLYISNNFYLISTNYGPANCDEWKKACHDVFSKMTDVCFRDVMSFDAFRDLKNVRYAPDAVLSIDVDNSSKNKILEDKYIIMSIIDCSMNDRSDKLNASTNDYESKMAYLINEFNKRGVNVILLNSNTIQDKPASERILEKCKNKTRNLVYDYDGNIKELFNIYINATAIIATRLHTIILGWLYEIPVIPIVYDIKVENLLNSYKFDGFSEKITNMKNIDFFSINYAIENYSFKISKDILNESQNQFEKIDILLK